jgi:hypothetical protein
VAARRLGAPSRHVTAGCAAHVHALVVCVSAVVQWLLQQALLVYVSAVVQWMLQQHAARASCVPRSQLCVDAAHGQTFDHVHARKVWASKQPGTCACGVAHDGRDASWEGCGQGA